MRSLYSGVSGLKAHQTRMDVIANNIANVNTTAYKSSRVTFSDYYSQTISSGQSGNSTRGGTNAMQIGLGSSVGSIDINMGQGSAQRTDRSLDCMINGEGFFILGSGTDTYFTRDGNFGLDSYGNLVTAGGMQVEGWSAMEDPLNPGEYIASEGSVSPITLTADQQTMPPKITTALEVSGNINVVADPSNPDAEIEHFTTMSFYDSLGNEFLVDAKYVWDPTAKTMGLEISDAAYLNGDREQAYPITVSGSGGDIEIDFAPAGTDVTGEYSDSLGNITFTDDGVVDTTASDAGGLFNITIGGTENLSADTYFGDPISLDCSNLTNFDNVESDAIIEALDGNPPGSLSNISIAADGSLMGVYTNGEQRLLATIAVAKFDNPAGLTRAGGNLFQASTNSGDFNGMGTSVEAIGSSISSGQLEMSNVDIATEFTDMIVTQRGFQANSKTITTSDEMLEELVNLKR